MSCLIAQSGQVTYRMLIPKMVASFLDNDAGTVRSWHFERFESTLWQTSSLLLISGREAVVVDP